MFGNPNPTQTTRGSSSDQIVQRHGGGGHGGLAPARPPPPPAAAPFTASSRRRSHGKRPRVAGSLPCRRSRPAAPFAEGRRGSPPEAACRTLCRGRPFTTGHRGSRPSRSAWPPPRRPRSSSSSQRPNACYSPTVRIWIYRSWCHPSRSSSLRQPIGREGRKGGARR